MLSIHDKNRTFSNAEPGNEQFDRKELKPYQLFHLSRAFVIQDAVRE